MSVVDAGEMNRTISARGAVAGKGSLQAAIVRAAPAGKMWIIFIPRKRPVCPSWAEMRPRAISSAEPAIARELAADVVADYGARR